MSGRWLALAFVLAATSPRAEVGWLASSARLEAEQRLSVFGGPGAIGGGAQWAVDEAARAFSAEASWSLFGRFLELRGDHLWMLRRGGWVSVSASAGLSAWLVPQPFDRGLGGHAALTVDLGRAVFSVAAGLQTEVAVFARAPGPRFAERLFLGLAGAAGPLGWALLARAGADFEPGRPFVARAELVLELSWLLRSSPGSGRGPER
jgi:hypothetical protein